MNPWNWIDPRHSAWQAAAGVLVAMVVSLARAAAEEVVLAGFDGTDFGGWVASGEAFGTSPAPGTLPEQAPVSGFRGKGFANSFHGGDRSRGTLTSPEFELTLRYLNFLVGGGELVGRTCVNVLVDGQVVRSATGRDEEALLPATFDLGEFSGKKARIQLVDDEAGGWGHVTADQFVLSDRPAVAPYVQNPVATSNYTEALRPQFHFTSRSNWLNDPNGLVSLAGEHHLFFQHNPAGRDWGNMTWGHAVGTNFVEWSPLPHALEPDALGTVFSGSVVVDRENTGGFQTGPEPALVAIYTAAGGTSEASKGRPFTQCLAFSNDRGRTWTRFSGNPVVTNLAVGDRDPKVFWHASTRRWIMPLYVGIPEASRKKGSLGEEGQKPELRILTSADLKSWKQESVFPDELYECPGLVELPVDGDRKNTRWLLWGADGRYWICRFDGRELTPESGPHVGDYGAHFYAAQAWDSLPDQRVVLMGWMRGGKYPGMPFNQQMGFPVDLSLRTTPEGIRLVKWPVPEISNLFTSSLREDLPRPLRAGTYPIPAGARELMDVEWEFLPGTASEVSLSIRGQRFTWRAKASEWVVQGRSMPLKPTPAGLGRRSQFPAPWGPDFNPWEGSIRLRVLVDRTSMELFGGGGLAVASFCYLPTEPPSMEVDVNGGEVSRARITIRGLRSAWRP